MSSAKWTGSASLLSNDSLSKRAAYGDDEDSPPTPSDDDSDFDDDEDPDNLEVPGGGKTLAAAARLAPSKGKGTPAPVQVTVKPTTNPLAAPSGVAFGQATNIKPIKISASQITKPINLGGMGRGANFIKSKINVENKCKLEQYP
ncbi:hypothetical protein evm_014900 [Chilo suppressalis]|nr:hypothetical protein evm_014900 [Chilo suppressalis]